MSDATHHAVTETLLPSSRATAASHKCYATAPALPPSDPGQTRTQELGGIWVCEIPISSSELSTLCESEEAMGWPSERRILALGGISDALMLVGLSRPGLSDDILPCIVDYPSSHARAVATASSCRGSKHVLNSNSATNSEATTIEATRASWH